MALCGTIWHLFFIYNPLTYNSNKLQKIIYDNTETVFSYPTNKVTVNHYSGVNYELTVSDLQYISKGSATEGQETVSYSQELQLSDNEKTIAINDNTILASISANGYITSYDYDANGQLIRENNQALDKTFQYEYNGIGNLTSIRAYSYTPAGTEPSGTYTTTSFGYSADRLTTCGSESISYNTMGCPTTYDGYNTTWTRGKLSRLSMGNRTTGTRSYNYVYNAHGQRTSATYSRILGTSELNSVQSGELMGDSKAFYYDHLGRLVAETSSKTSYNVGESSESIVFLYDENTIIGMVRTASGATNTYYFARNLLGDVIGIHDTNGNRIVEYVYDAYGNCTIKGTTTNYVIANKKERTFMFVPYFY